jgi:hypothetical protein
VGDLFFAPFAWSSDPRIQSRINNHVVYAATRPIELAEMKTNRGNPRDTLTLALQAISNLVLPDLEEFFADSMSTAISAQDQIRLKPVAQRTSCFYEHYVPLRKAVVSQLAVSYRRYFKLALAHERQIGFDSEEWARDQIQPAVRATLEWIADWFVLACDGTNQYVQPIGSIEFLPGQTSSLSIPLTVPLPPSLKSWRAPAWLFRISIALVGVGALKTKNVPSINSEEKLGAAHTRLLLRGARRVFLWDLEAAIERARNEETAAAGAFPTATGIDRTRTPNKRKGWQERQKLYEAIRKILSKNSTLQGMAFCGELDKRHAPPLLDWIERREWPEGTTWKEAWGNETLRGKIRRVRQEAMKDR